MLALTSPTNGCHSIGVVRSRTQATEFFLAYRLNRLRYRVPQRQTVLIRAQISSEEFSRQVPGRTKEGMLLGSNPVRNVWNDARCKLLAAESTGILWFNAVFTRGRHLSQMDPVHTHPLYLFKINFCCFENKPETCCVPACRSPSVRASP
jgi:hypothetical protein